MVALRMWAKRILCLLVAAFFVVSLTARPARGEEHASSVRVATAQSTQVMVNVSFVAPDGEWDRVDGVTLEAGATAWSATKAALVQSRLYYTTGLPSSSDALVSLTRSMDEAPLAFDVSTGSGWHLYLNDKRCRKSASSCVLADGDEISWRYEVGTFRVRVSVVGPGGTDAAFWVRPTSVRIDYAQNAWDASREVFEKSGYKRGRLLSYTVAEDGYVTLDSLAALGENGITGESWHAYVNGELVDDIAHAELRAGDSICWYYAGNGETSLPDFVLKSGAASPNPTESVRIAGVVAQVWSHAVMDDEDEGLASLPGASGLQLSGSERLAMLSHAPHARLGVPTCAEDDGSWAASLAYVLDGAVGTGMGGCGAKGQDGRTYYVDARGSVVALEERT